MVVTAAEQNLQAPGVSTITADEIRKHPPRATCRRSFAPCRGQPDRQLHQRPARQQPARLISAAWGPENTLILIDGKPVTSRNSVRPWLARRA